MKRRAGWRWFSYEPEDAKAAQAHLNELAEEGLELEDVWYCAAKFRRVEGRGAPCWVEPARWTGMSRKQEERRAEYLSLCEEAGWELVEQSHGMFWFRARPGTTPAPLQSDQGVEWDSVWKRLLADRSFQLLWVALFLFCRFFVDFWRQKPHLWEIFLVDGNTLASAAALLLMILLALYCGIHALLYRHACRQAVGDGRPIPVPRAWAAKWRGVHWAIQAALLCFALLALLAAAGSSQSQPDVTGPIYSWRTISPFVVRTEYHRFREGDYLNLDDYDCRSLWLAEWIAPDLAADEGNQRYLDRQMLHGHDAVTPQPADLGFDQAWRYDLGGGREGLVARLGSRVIRLELDGDLDNPDTLAALQAWMAADTGEE